MRSGRRTSTCAPAWTLLLFSAQLPHPLSRRMTPADFCYSISQLETVLSTVVNNGLKAGWLALGHGQSDTSESSILPLLDPPRHPASSNPPIRDAGAEVDFQPSAVLSALASSRSSKTERDEL
jgi:hypothetical protein